MEYILKSTFDDLVLLTFENIQLIGKMKAFLFEKRERVCCPWCSSFVSESLCYDQYKDIFPDESTVFFFVADMLNFAFNC